MCLQQRSMLKPIFVCGWLLCCSPLSALSIRLGEGYEEDAGESLRKLGGPDGKKQSKEEQAGCFVTFRTDKLRKAFEKEDSCKDVLSIVSKKQVTDAYDQTLEQVSVDLKVSSDALLADDADDEDSLLELSAGLEVEPLESCKSCAKYLAREAEKDAVCGKDQEFQSSFKDFVKSFASLCQEGTERKQNGKSKDSKDSKSKEKSETPEKKESKKLDSEKSENKSKDAEKKESEKSKKKSEKKAEKKESKKLDSAKKSDKKESKKVDEKSETSGKGDSNIGKVKELIKSAGKEGKIGKSKNK